jgi:hypothetical protein
MNATPLVSLFKGEKSAECVLGISRKAAVLVYRVFDIDHIDGKISGSFVP